MSSVVAVRTSEGREFTISRLAARHSGMIYGAIADFEGFPIPEAINLDHVTGEMFEKILPFMEHYEAEEPKAIETPIWRPFEETVPEWDAKFIESIPPKELNLMNKAAEYLLIEPLLELIATSMACFTKDRSLEEACEYYGIPMPSDEQLKEIEKIYWEQYALPADM